MANEIRQKPLADRELSAFCAQVGMLLHAGISLPEGIRLMQEDTADPGARQILALLLENCELGEPFFTALEQTGVFPAYFLDMVRIGEASGRLEEVMLALQHYYDRRQTVQENIRSAVRYPLVMIAMMVLVVAVLAAKVLPVFDQVFRQLGARLSGPAAGVMAMGNWLSRYAIVLVALAAVLCAAFFWMNRTLAGQKARRALGMRFFITRGLYRRMALAQFANALALLLASGLDPGQSLEMARRLSDHPVVQSQIDDCKRRLDQDDSFCTALVESGLFSGVYGRMLSVAFKAGSADTVMRQLADRCAEQVEQEVDDKICLIEPTLVAVFSVIVGLILLSVMLPLVGIMSAIG